MVTDCSYFGSNSSGAHGGAGAGLASQADPAHRQLPPGGAADQIARAISLPLQEALGQPVIVDNRAGAGGNIGGDALAKSPPDGYTLLLTSGEPGVLQPVKIYLKYFL